MKKKLVALLILTTLYSCAPKENTGPAISEEKTREVLVHHDKAFKENDIEAIMADYTDESVLIIPDGTYKGLKQIRENYEQAFAAFPKDSTTMTVTKTVVVNDLGYILWQARTPKFEVQYGTDTFIVQDGKILRQTFAGVFK
jgi:hypothetical protein